MVKTKISRSKMFLEGTIHPDEGKMVYVVPIDLTKVDEANELRALKSPHALFFDCKELHVDAQYVTYVYEMDKEYLPIARARSLPMLLKLAVAENLLDIQALKDSEFVSFICPENLYFRKQQNIKLVYRGIAGLTHPTDEHDLYAVQCLIVDLFTKYRFHEVKKKGLYRIYEESTDFVKHVIDARSFADLKAAIERERERLQEAYIARQDEKEKVARIPQRKWLLVGCGILAAAGLFWGSLALGKNANHPKMTQAAAKATQKTQQLQSVQDKYTHLQKQLINTKKELDEAKDQLGNQRETSKLYRFYVNGNDKKVIQEANPPGKITNDQKWILAKVYIRENQWKKAYQLAKDLKDKKLGITVINKQIDQLREGRRGKNKKAMNELNKQKSQLEKGNFK